MTRRHLFIVAALLCVPSGLLSAQSGGATSALQVTGDVGSALTLTASDLKSMPRTRVEIKEEARTVVYEGVLVADLLKKAGAPLGPDLRGDALATYVVASARDGYQVVFSLGEMDPALSGHQVIVADSVDGKPLFSYQGTFRLVVPRDTRAARSVRMLEQLNVVRLKK